MLLALRLKDFVIVDAAEIEFGRGFSVLSGETGAGKSILIDALGLALGARADASLVREGAIRADITASFDTDPPLERWLAERELAGDEGLVLVRRIVESDGRSKAFVNGHAATATQLRELGERLVDVHGQHAAQSLLRGGGQRDLLDAFGGLQAQARAVGEAHASWREHAARLEAAEGDSRELELRRERLQWQVGELEALALGPGEWAQLNTEQKRLAHAAALLEGAAQAAAALGDDDEAIGARLGQVGTRLRPLAAIDPRLQAPLELLETATIHAQEAASALADYARDMDLDPQRLEAVETRIGAVFAAARKFRLAPEAIADELPAMQQELARLTADRDLDALRAEVARLRGRFETLARELSTGRRAAAAKLAAGVTRQIGRLGMAGGRLEIPIETASPSAAGIDAIEYRVAGHAGGSARPLAKVASGGELSRIGLAIAVLAAQANPVPTLIFDEADAGVGGAVAEVIGELMRELGNDRQVLCVTHLPQVAAKAHQHLLVSKEATAGRTTSSIRTLGRADRVEEIARMLGGVEITATTRKHARELLAQG